jgi:hypothetical protein
MLSQGGIGSGTGRRSDITRSAPSWFFKAVPARAPLCVGGVGETV